VGVGPQNHHYLARHATGDWGDLDNRRENERSLCQGWRILSRRGTYLGRHKGG